MAATSGRSNYSGLIQTDRRPSVPDGWTIATHHPLGFLNWCPTHHNAELIQHELQLVMYMSGAMVQREFRHRRFLNASVLDVLLFEPAFYPEEWKTDESGRPKFIAFFGTLYDQPRDHPWVRIACWDHYRDKPEDDIVDMSDRWFGKRCYAAVLKQLSREREGAVG